MSSAIAPPCQIRQQLEVTTRPYGKEIVRTLRYWLFLPEGYQDDGQKQWPLLLFLHGAGQRGDDLEQVKKHGPPKFVESRAGFPLVTISPQCPFGRRWEKEQLVQLVEHVAATRSIDRARLYVTGLSMGGYGTWALVAAYPDLFAAAAPICGGGIKEDAPKIGRLPIWAFHGDQDPVAPLSQTQEMVDAVQAAGGDARLTIYPGVEHDSWTATYENPDLYDWLLAQRRNRV